MSYALVLPFVVMLVFMVLNFRSARRKMDGLTSHAGLLLDSVELAERGQVRGKLAGREVFVNLTTRGSGSSSVAWTEITATHEASAVSLALRPQTLAESAIVALSKAVDVKIGDEAFDRAYVVDGAPEAVVKSVLDDVVLRESLMILERVEVDDTGETLKISMKGWVEQPVMTRMLNVVTTLAQRMEHFTSEGASIGPYRGAPPVGAERELQALAQARARRNAVRNKLIIAFIIMFIGTCVAITQSHR